MVLVDDPLFSREALKDYADKHDRSSKKRLIKSDAAQTPDHATVRKKLSIPGKTTYICGGKHDIDNCTVFNK